MLAAVSFRNLSLLDTYWHIIAICYPRVLMEILTSNARSVKVWRLARNRICWKTNKINKQKPKIIFWVSVYSMQQWWSDWLILGRSPLGIDVARTFLRTKSFAKMFWPALWLSSLGFLPIFHRFWSSHVILKDQRKLIQADINVVDRINLDEKPCQAFAERNIPFWFKTHFYFWSNRYRRLQKFSFGSARILVPVDFATGNVEPSSWLVSSWIVLRNQDL